MRAGLQFSGIPQSHTSVIVPRARALAMALAREKGLLRVVKRTFLSNGSQWKPWQSLTTLIMHAVPTRATGTAADAAEIIHSMCLLSGDRFPNVLVVDHYPQVH